MNPDFDHCPTRENTSCYKYDLRSQVFGRPDVTPMWVADMDFKTPDFILDAIKERLSHEVLGYTFRGKSFGDSLAGWLLRQHGWKIDPSWVCFSPGIVPAFSLAILAYTKPGDKVIVQRPVYFPFFPAIENLDRVLVNNPLQLKGDRYQIDFDDLESKIDSSVRMIFFCSPHNPTGNVWNREELKRLTRICLKNNVIILSDEIHSDLVFPERTHIPLASLGDDIAAITLTCLAPSKTFNLAGMSTSAMVISNPDLRRRYEKILDDIHVAGGNIFGFTAFNAAFNHGDNWLKSLMEYLDINRQYLLQFFRERLPIINPIVPEATYMAWLDCRALKLDDKALSQFFIHEAGLGLSEGTLFGPEGSGFMRLNFGCPTETLKMALEQLYQAVRNRFVFELKK